MCGIFAHLYKKRVVSNIDNNLANVAQVSPNLDIVHCSSTIQHRGPDSTVMLQVENDTYDSTYVFHRLAINELSPSGNQPMQLAQYPGVTLMCNGEIYNWKQLAHKYAVCVTSGSDCEIILHLYNILPSFQDVLVELDGPFAIVLHDSRVNTTFVARDRFGIRSLYSGLELVKTTNLFFASELKAIPNTVDHACQFPPGTYCVLKDVDFNNIQTMDDIVYQTYYHYQYICDRSIPFSIDTTLFTIRKQLEKAVTKRLLSDRPIGCLLSGGLDSSIISALVAKSSNVPIHTFSIGMVDSPDLKYAKIVADHIGSIHHEIIVSVEDMISHIPTTIYQIESYDTTTVRASTPMHYLCKYIKEHTDICVIFSGEGSDEASGSYLYFYNAPTQYDFQEETVRLLRDLQYFDVLRSDKCTAGNGLEVRVPFLDVDFINMYMSIDPLHKMPKHYGIEKYLLRKAFDDGSLLPSSVLWRTKEAFSDGVSGREKSWYQHIQDYLLNLKCTAPTTLSSLVTCSDNSNTLYQSGLELETAYYLDLFNKDYKKFKNTIPYYWLPKWCGNMQDPSARKLNVYDEIGYSENKK